MGLGCRVGVGELVSVMQFFNVGYGHLCQVQDHLDGAVVE